MKGIRARFLTRRWIQLTLTPLLGTVLLLIAAPGVGSEGIGAWRQGGTPPGGAVTDLPAAEQARALKRDEHPGKAETQKHYYPASHQLPGRGNPHGYDLRTLDAWKQRFDFPARQQDESLDAYRKRAGIVVYYNENELGLGRELGCSTFEDRDDSGKPISEPGIACFVTNYGQAFQDRTEALLDALGGKNARNTVAISYQPSLPTCDRVQFAAYDADDRITSFLKTFGPRPIPQICMNCHGGTYDSNRHLAQGARFLPINISAVTFADVPGYTRSDQEQALRQINDLVNLANTRAGSGCAE